MRPFLMLRGRKESAMSSMVTIVVHSEDDIECVEAADIAFVKIGLDHITVSGMMTKDERVAKATALLKAAMAFLEAVEK